MSGSDWHRISVREMAALEVGTKLRLFYGRGHHANVLFHVRGHLDDRVFVRRWLRRWKSWEYQVLDDVWWDTRREHVTVETPSGKCVGDDAGPRPGRSER